MVTCAVPNTLQTEEVKINSRKQACKAPKPHQETGKPEEVWQLWNPGERKMTKNANISLKRRFNWRFKGQGQKNSAVFFWGGLERKDAPQRQSRKRRGIMALWCRVKGCHTPHRFDVCKSCFQSHIYKKHVDNSLHMDQPNPGRNKSNTPNLPKKKKKKIG